MKKILEYVKLLRIKQWIKNLLVIVPAFFGGVVFDTSLYIIMIKGLFAFSFAASAIYVLNDLCDIEKDKNHPQKCTRPLAAGTVTKAEAYVLLGFCVGCSVVLSSGFDVIALCYLVVYFVLNVLYSRWFKRVPIVDVVILASGYVIRVFFGGQITSTEISTWFYLIVIVGALFMGLGKRRNELSRVEETRDVLKFYSYDFLDKNLYVCMGLVDMFYALWAKEQDNPYYMVTVPLVMVIMMKYSYNLEKGDDGDPTNLLLKDKILIALVAIYVILMIMILYIFRK